MKSIGGQDGWKYVPIASITTGVLCRIVDVVKDSWGGIERSCLDLRVKVFL